MARKEDEHDVSIAHGPDEAVDAFLHLGSCTVMQRSDCETHRFQLVLNSLGIIGTFQKGTGAISIVANHQGDATTHEDPVLPLATALEVMPGVEQLAIGAMGLIGCVDRATVVVAVGVQQVSGVLWCIRSAVTHRAAEAQAGMRDG
jgi:hypothetical protein